MAKKSVVCTCGHLEEYHGHIQLPEDSRFDDNCRDGDCSCEAFKFDTLKTFKYLTNIDPEWFLTDILTRMELIQNDELDSPASTTTFAINTETLKRVARIQGLHGLIVIEKLYS